MASIFAAGGLASGIDTNSIVDNLVKIESAQVDILRGKQSALKTQVSLLGDITSKLSLLNDAAKALGTNGVLAVTSTATNTAFSVTPGQGARAGLYAVGVSELATAAKARSAAFADNFSEVTEGTLTLGVSGTNYDVAIASGATLADVASAVNASGAPVVASLISDGTNTYLSLTAAQTGFPVGGVAADALTVTENYAGTSGQALGLATTNTATNAKITVDGLPIERRNNEITDVLQGTTISLKAKTTTDENVVLAADPAATATKLQTFVDAYNQIIKVVQKQFAVTDVSNRNTSLAGDTALRSLQQSLQRFASTQVAGLTDVRSLADIGVKTARDGSLSLDQTVLEKAMSRAPASVDALFAKVDVGIAALSKEMVAKYTNSTDGTLTTRKKSLDDNVTKLESDVEKMQARVDKFRERLIAQFTAMEKIVSSMKSIGNFLTQQENQSKGS